MWYFRRMKAIQVTLDEDLLHDLDADERVRQIGRSALLRQLARDYIRCERERRIDEQYARAYGEGRGMDAEWEDWEDSGDWPSDTHEGGK